MAFLIDPELLADNIKFHRRRSSYTVRQLADQTLLPVHVIESMESGRVTPTSDQLRRVAQVLGVHTEDLVLPRPADLPYQEGC